jgi:hypothetical protein
MNNRHLEAIDLSPQGYQVDRVLGQNVHGGRVTYLAQDLLSNFSLQAIPGATMMPINEKWIFYNS